MNVGFFHFLFMSGFVRLVLYLLSSSIPASGLSEISFSSDKTSHSSTNTVRLVLYLLSSSILASAITPLGFEYRSFNGTYLGTLQYTGNVALDTGALQITPDTSSTLDRFQNKSGRVVYQTPFKLWEGVTAHPGTVSTVLGVQQNKGPCGVVTEGDVNSGKIASFNTSFDVNIYRHINTTPGEGLTFIIASDLDIPAQSYGQYLGLTNVSTDGNLTNHLISIELDTIKQEFDPNDNHMGLNINNIKSNKGISLASQEKFPEENDKTSLKIGLGAGIPGLALLLVTAVGFCYFLHKRRPIMGALKILPGTPREFRFKDLRRATNNFHEKMKLRQSGFGIAYKGVLAKENNMEITAKKFSRENIQGKDDFLAELTIINRLRHKHLVRLVGMKNGTFWGLEGESKREDGFGGLGLEEPKEMLNSVVVIEIEHVNLEILVVVVIRVLKLKLRFVKMEGEEEDLRNSK
ncbi:hypothetical protein GIB67_028042 [Kingdonia uniflora]|uniref:Legume lectin domain-containing protein n=1 Tax=Kingdonia uniflora TaxID=39325 RepID=A0A7J7KY98_9MAGN|nr:hypothetical protein GIB67_028042 [Kingdonia uniflora]